MSGSIEFLDPVSASAPYAMIEDDLSQERPANVVEQRVNTLAKCAFQQINIGYEVLKIGIQRANLYVKEISAHANEAKDIQVLLKKNIDLNAKLSLIGDKNELVITDDMRALAKELREKGVQTFNDDEKVLSRDRITEIKTNIGMQIDTLKTEMQVIFSSMIQPKISEMNSLIETLKMIERYQTKLLDAIIANSTKR